MMNRKLLTRQLSIALLLFVAGLVLAIPRPAPAQDCACFDTDNNGTCDVTVTNAQLLGGPVSNLASAFVIPAGCEITLNSAPGGGVRVTARRIVVEGSLFSTPTGGEGVLFTATEDIRLLPGSSIVSGGANKLSTTGTGNEAIAKASVGLKAGTTCTLLGTFLKGNPTTGSGQVGIQCREEIAIHGSQIIASGIDIQSLSGEIDASGSGPGGSAQLRGLACDDPDQNPHGNDNGVLDAGDFPCRFNFSDPLSAGLTAISDFCGPPNVIQALNNPLVIISRANLNISGAELLGNFSILLFAENGNMDASSSTISNGPSPPGGATISMVADPAGVNRLPVLKETATGPFAGIIDVDRACITSPNPIGFGGTVTGLLEFPGCSGGTGTVIPGAGLQCDDSAQNLAGNGNNNSILDSGDFECTIQFPTPFSTALAAINAFCEGQSSVCGNGVVESGEQCDDDNTVNGDGCSASCQVEPPLPVCGNGVVESGEQCDDDNTVNGDGCSASCQVEPPAGGEGCTPGFWKQSQRFDSWPAPITPTTLFSAVFENAFPGKTLLQVLQQGGGGLKALGRHTAAALLNSASPDVNYDLSYSDVIGMFNAVFPGSNRNYDSLKNTFEVLNQQHCPVN